MKTIQFSIRKSVRTIFPIFLFVFCFAFTSQAITYYVSTTGNDVTGTGTAGNPWKTLYKATNMVSAAGDIIHVNAGTYIETLQSQLKPGVSIEGDGVTSLIKNSITTLYTALLNLASVEGTNGNQHISNLKFDGQLTSTWGITIFGRSNVSIHDCTIINFFDRGVIFSGRNDNIDGAPSVFATGNSFYNNILQNCADYNSFGRGCLNIGGQDGLSIHNNLITQYQRATRKNGWPIKYWDNGYNKNLKIYTNTLTKNIFTGSFGGDGDWDFAIELWWNLGGTEIYNNTVQGSFDLVEGTKGTAAYTYYIHDNFLSQPSQSLYYQAGFIFERGCETMVLEKNKVVNCNSAVEFQIEDFGDGHPYSHYTDITIQKNLFKNLAAQTYPSVGNCGGIIFAPNSSTATFDLTNITIVNNTITANSGNAPFFGNLITLGNNVGNITNFVFANNIVKGFQNSGLAMYYTNPVFNTLKVFNNVFFAPGINGSPYFNSTIPSNYTFSGNTSSDPLLTGAYDTIGVASPCVDAGINVGLPFAGVAPDRGYAELNSIILPVKLINFGVTENQGKNLLQWTTATENNSDYISIERSSDGRNFTSIGTVKAAGFSSADIHYTFTDATPLTGLNYYRLALVDKDNSKGYSNTVAVSNKSNTSLNIATAKLSRSNNNIAITVVSAQNQKTSIALFDANGKLFLNETVQLQKGMNTINKNTSALSSGIYYIKLSAADETVVKNVLSKE